MSFARWFAVALFTGSLYFAALPCRAMPPSPDNREAGKDLPLYDLDFSELLPDGEVIPFEQLDNPELGLEKFEWQVLKGTQEKIVKQGELTRKEMIRLGYQQGLNEMQRIPATLSASIEDFVTDVGRLPEDGRELLLYRASDEFVAGFSELSKAEIYESWKYFVNPATGRFYGSFQDPDAGNCELYVRIMEDPATIQQIPHHFPLATDPVGLAGVYLPSSRVLELNILGEQPGDTIFRQYRAFDPDFSALGLIESEQYEGQVDLSRAIGRCKMTSPGEKSYPNVILPGDILKPDLTEREQRLLGIFELGNGDRIGTMYIVQHLVQNWQSLASTSRTGSSILGQRAIGKKQIRMPEMLTPEQLEDQLLEWYGPAINPGTGSLFTSLDFDQWHWLGVCVTKVESGTLEYRLQIFGEEPGSVLVDKLIPWFRFSTHGG